MPDKYNKFSTKIWPVPFFRFSIYFGDHLISMVYVFVVSAFFRFQYDLFHDENFQHANRAIFQIFRHKSRFKGKTTFKK